MIIRNKFNGYSRDGRRTYNMGGGGGGGQTTSTGTTYNTNIPEYAQPYVETMLGATQKQLFETQPGADGTTEITGFRPYKPYSADPTAYIAPFSPMQQQAQREAFGMRTPGQFAPATGIAGAAGMGQLGTSQQALGLGAQGVGIGQMGLAGAMPAFGAGQQYMQGVTDPSRVGAFMSPYQQAVTDVQKAAAVREAQMADQAARLGAARQGTYGGARETLARSERERNLLANLSNIQAQGSQAAYDRALAQMQFGSNLGLQGIQTGLQGIQAGQQGVAQGLAGVGAQQAGYAGAGQTAATLGQLGTSQQQADIARMGLQNQIGAQQQAQQQNIINQAIQDYATQQQYPLMQLGFMSNMLRGLPMQATTTQTYMPTANPMSQAIGFLGAGANLYSAFKAKGGQIKEKKMASGGIASYAPGGSVNALYGIDDPNELKEIARNTTSDTIRREALRLARMKELGLAGGGIVAFQAGGTYRDAREALEADKRKEREEADRLANLLAVENRNQANLASQADVRRSDMDIAAAEALREYPASPGSQADVRRVDAEIARNVERDANKVVPAAPASQADVRRSDMAIEKGILQAKAKEKEDKGEDRAPSDTRADAGAGAPTAGGRGIPGFSRTVQALYDRAMPESRSIADLTREVREAREQTIGPNVRAQERRKELMEEKANVRDEAARTEKLRRAAFFADWASVPGPTLQAGMAALKRAIPGMVEDKTNTRKALGEIDKIVDILDKSDRAEAEGDFALAYKLRADANKEAKDLNKALLQYEMQKETAQVRATGTDRLSATKMFTEAQRARDKAQAELNRIRQSKGYQEAVRKSQIIGDSEAMKKRREEGKAEIARLESEQLAIIEDNQAVLEEAGKILGRKVGRDSGDSGTTRGKGAPGTPSNPIKL